MKGNQTKEKVDFVEVTATGMAMKTLVGANQEQQTAFINNVIAALKATELPELKTETRTLYEASGALLTIEQKLSRKGGTILTILIMHALQAKLNTLSAQITKEINKL